MDMMVVSIASRKNGRKSPAISFARYFHISFFVLVSASRLAPVSLSTSPELVLAFVFEFVEGVPSVPARDCRSFNSIDSIIPKF